MKWRLALISILLIPCAVISFRFNVDLKVLHAVAQWIQSDWTRIYGDNGASGRFFYGPVTLLFLIPLKFQSYQQSQWYYLFVQTVSYCFFWYALYRATPRLWTDKKAAVAWVFLFIFSINPLHNNFQSGNIQLQLIALLLLSELLASDVMSGAIAAIPILVKVFPILLLPYYFLMKNKKFWLGLVLGTVVLHLGLYALSSADVVQSLYSSFLRNLSTYSQDNSLTQIPDLLSLPSLFARIGLEKNTLVISGLLYSLAIGIVWLNRKEKSLLSFSLILAVVAVLNPSTRVHYFIFYVPLFAYFCNHAYESSRTLGWVLVSIVLLLVAFTVEGIVGKHLNDTLEFMSIPTIGVLLLILISLVHFKNITSNEA